MLEALTLFCSFSAARNTTSSVDYALIIALQASKMRAQGLDQTTNTM